MSLPTDLHAFDAGELAGAYRRKDLSPVQVAEALLARIDYVDGALNAFCYLDEATTLAEARESERRFAVGAPLGLLDGVPVAVKDFFLTKGWPTRKGSKLVDADQSWRHDAPAVARLREAGAVLIGKTTTPEFGWKGVTDSPLTGITRNPWDTAVTPGGSSGGSAAAVAAGLAPLALGTDAGGSVRIPGAFTGTVGLKPTFGRIPYAPPSAFGSLAHAGPMARTAADAAALFAAVAVHDHRDWTALPTTPVGSRAEDTLDGLRILFSADLGYVQVDPEIGRAVASAVAVLEDLGAHVESNEPGIDDPRETWEVLWYAGAAALVATLDPGRRSEMDPGLLEIAEAGVGLSAVDYLAAERSRVEAAVSLAETLIDYDLLVTPTMPVAPFEAGREVPDGWPHSRWQTWSPFTIPFNLSQQPAITVPCGLTASGLPIGLQIVAAKHRDGLALAAAAAYESARGDRMRFVRPIDIVERS